MAGQKWNDAGQFWTTSGDVWPFFAADTPPFRDQTLSQIRVVLYKAGADPLELTPIHNSLSWSTNAVGGFGSCSFTLPGIWAKTKVNYLDIIRAYYGPRVLFEGRVEDVGLTVDEGGTISTEVQAFGLARKLDDYSVRRVWSKRDLGWQQVPVGRGGSLGSTYLAADVDVATGSVEPTDLTLNGVKVAGNSASVAASAGGAAQYLAPLGLQIVKLLFDWTRAGSVSFGGIAGSSADGSTWSYTTYTATAAAQTLTLAASAAQIRLGWVNTTAGALTPVSSDYGRFTNVRLLGSTVNEDVAGGFYGDSILRDLMVLIPGLTLGVVESGSDFTIQAIERAIRDTIRSVVNEVAGYYAREWAVWDADSPGAGMFQWVTPSLNEPQWIVPLEALESLNIRGTVDGEEATTYVLYTDAVSGLDAEASSTSTDQRNPFVKQGVSRDGLTRSGFPMTTNTSAALAAVVNSQNGLWPPVTGTITLPILRPVQHAYGPTHPAFAIRAGENVQIVGLPKSNPLQGGRDGETFFHVSSSDVDLSRGTVTLTLEGQTRTVDQLLARLAAVTRTLTG